MFSSNMRNLILTLAVVFPLGLIAQVRAYDTLPNLPDHYNKRLALFRKQPATSHQVMMVGNSITEGGNWKKLLGDSTVINRGISGDVTWGVSKRLDEITRHQPSSLFLLIGINDLSRNVPPEVVLENIFNIVYRIRTASPQTKIYVQSILPVNETFTNFLVKFKGKSESILVINNNLSKYADKMKYTFIDIHSKFSDANGNLEKRFATDGLHLNAAGYQQWAGILKGYLTKK